MNIGKCQDPRETITIEYCPLNIEYLRSAFGGSLGKTAIEKNKRSDIHKFPTCALNPTESNLPVKRGVVGFFWKAIS